MNFTDQTGCECRLTEYPERIISLVPSITELLFDLDLSEEIVGITKFCTKPEIHVAEKVKIGGTKNFNFNIIDQLRPDLIIGNKEENYKDGIIRLEKHYPVWLSDISSINTALNMILEVGKLVDKKSKARYLYKKIKADITSVKRIFPVLKTAYLIWKNPYMTVGGDTFINSMLEISGFSNIFSAQKRYPVIHLDELEQAELILLSTEPYRFTEKDVDTFRKRFINKSVHLVDGAIFSWYGSRMQYVAEEIKKLRSEI